MSSLLYIRIKHGAATHDITVPHNATLGDFKTEVCRVTTVPVDRQRLLVAGIARLPSDLSTPLTTAFSGTTTVIASPVPIPATTKPHVLVIGAPVAPPSQSGIPSGDDSMSTSTSAEKSSTGTLALQCVPQETSRGLYSCSYGSGQVSQHAFYCRTCVDAGHADPKHFMCYGCAEYCHEGHDVENWGLHTYLRCDCSTARCCKNPERAVTWQPASSPSPRTEEGEREMMNKTAITGRRCAFICEECTGKPPAVPLMSNERNIYPTETNTWCYCAGSEALPDEDEDAVNCILCHNCYYFPHMTRLHSDYYLTVPCYVETSGFSTLGYRCVTCNDNKLLCPPCAVQCHAGHELDQEPVVIDHRAGATPAERALTCACASSGNSCRIAVSVPDTRLIELGPRDVNASGAKPLVPPWMARQLVADDELCAFVCAGCMQEHPWLWNTNAAPGGHTDLTALRSCWGGNLPKGQPAGSPASMANKVPRCRTSITHNHSTSSSPTTSATTTTNIGLAPPELPYHGMLVAEDFFRFLCPCSQCQSAFAALSPRNPAAVESLELFVPFEVECSECGTDVDRGQGYICTTCELVSGETYFLCTSCYSNASLREAHDAVTTALPSSSSPSQGPHQFEQDTLDNLWRLFGAQLVNNVDPTTKEWMISNWESGEAKTAVLAMLHDATFGAKSVATGDVHAATATLNGSPTATATGNPNTSSGTTEDVNHETQPPTSSEGNNDSQSARPKRPRDE